MRRLDAEHIHQADGVFRHVAQRVRRGDRDLQEPQLEQFDGTQPLAAAQPAGFADVAIVEPDHAKSAGRKLPAELVIPMDHLGSQSHDQQHRLRAGVAEDLVTEVDAVGAGDLRRLMSCYIHSAVPLGMVAEWYCDEDSMTWFSALQKAP